MTQKKFNSKEGLGAAVVARLFSPEARRGSNLVQILFLGLRWPMGVGIGGYGTIAGNGFRPSEAIKSNLNSHSEVFPGAVMQQENIL